MNYSTPIIDGYNAVVDPTNNLPLEDIQAHPENYLNYVYISEEESGDDAGTRALKEIEELKAAIERGLTV